MKNRLPLLIATCLFSLATLPALAQTIRRVNNTPGLNDPSVYTNAQAAHNAAAAGDIISLEPSDNPDYGVLTVTKRVTIIGSGYFLDKNPNTPFDKRSVTLQSLTFDNGSANSVITGVFFPNGLSIRDVNITMTRCRTGNPITLGQSSNLVGGVYTSGNNATITDNFIVTNGNAVQGAYNGSTFTSGSNCTIVNNIILSNNGSISLGVLGNSVINYNTFYTNNGNILGSVKSSTFANNIIDARVTPAGYQVLDAQSTGNTVSNNMCLSVNGLPTGNGNVNGTNPSTVFVNASNPYATYNTNGDSDFQLSASSPARTAGVGSTQIGVFGGTAPYVLSGVPAYPVITSFTNTGAGNSSTPLTVTISVRSNN